MQVGGRVKGGEKGEGVEVGKDEWGKGGRVKGGKKGKG